jgi:hypothetical protein
MFETYISVVAAPGSLWIVSSKRRMTGLSTVILSYEPSSLSVDGDGITEEIPEIET